MAGKADPELPDSQISKQPLTSMGSKKVIINILSLGSGEVIARIVAYLGTAYLTRELGPAGFGIIGFANALYGYLSLPIHAGFQDMGSREVARRPHEASDIALSVTLVRLVLAFVALAILSLIAWLLNKSILVKQVVILTGLSFFSLALDTSWVYKGLERNHRVGLALVSGQILYVAALLYTVKGPQDILWVPISQFLGEGGTAFLLTVPLIPFRKFRWDFREGWHMLQNSGFSVLAHLLRMLIFTFDVVLMGFLLTEKEVGLYTASSRFCFLLMNVAAVIRISYIPALTRASIQGIQQIAEVAGHSIELSSVISIPLTIGGVLVAAPLLTTLFGPGYEEGAGAFRLLILSFGLIFFSDVTQNILLVGNRMKMHMGMVAVTAGINVGLNWVLIPCYGLMGAAFTTLLAEILLLLMEFWVVYRMGVRIGLKQVIRPLLAAGVMGLGLIALGSGRALSLYLGVGSILYFFVLAGLRGIPRDLRPYFPMKR